MEKINEWLNKIPYLLGCKTSIFIYLFLFLYLVIFPLICVMVPELKSLSPTDMTQLILGNYTNVLSALGASIAAGAGVSIHRGMKNIHKRHDSLLEKIDNLHDKVSELHEKIDNLEDVD